MTRFVTSKDGTSIAFSEIGEGSQHGGPLPDELAASLRSIAAPTVVLIGSKSPPYLRHAVERVAAEIPQARVEELPGQQHNVSVKAVAPVLASRSR